MNKEEAFEIAKKLKETSVNTDVISLCEYIFPELKESDARKDLINFLKSPFITRNICDWKVAPWIAWLEKQKPLSEDEYESVIKALKEGFKYYQLFNPTFGGIPCIEIVNWLEKQGEKKQDPCENCKDKCLNCDNFPCIDKRIFEQSKQEEPQVYETENGETITYSESEGYKVAGPKFKVGDWIACEELNSARIVAVDIDKYEVEFTDWAKAFPHIEYIDRNFHPWTIKDAKDGDILTNGELILIFKQFEEPAYMEHIIAYIGLDISSNIQVTDGYWQLGDKVSPATKEQYDLLFSKMKEAGYKWNSENKELKKIEQKPTWSEEDENIYQSIIDDTVQENQLNSKQTNWLRDIKYRYFPQSKQEWSEEDERMYKITLSCIETLEDISDGKNMYANVKDWIKSLKEGGK